MGTPEQTAALNEKAGHRVDLEALAQAHVNAITGACLALGIKYAGSASSGARTVLTDYLHYMLAAKKSAPDGSGGELVGQFLVNLQSEVAGIFKRAAHLMTTCSALIVCIAMLGILTCAAKVAFCHEAVSP